jgi:hypothetical protein
MAIPAIAAAAAAAGATVALGGAVSVATMGLTGALIVAGAGALASAAATALIGGFDRPDPPGSIGLGNDGRGSTGREEQVTGTTMPHAFGFGRTRTSGLRYVWGTRSIPGIVNGQFYTAYVIAGQRIRRIAGVYLNEKSEIDPAVISFCRFGRHRGTAAQLADADWLSEISDRYTASDRARGCAWVASRLTWDQAAFGASGLPAHSFLVDWDDDIYDPRTETRGFTNNWALCVARFLEAPHGKGLPYSKIDEPALIAAANICDERVEVMHHEELFEVDLVSGFIVLPDSLRVLDWGDGVRVSSSGALPTGLSAGVTYYVIPGQFENRISLATSPSNAMAMIPVSISSAGSGAHAIVYWDEARYKCNGRWTSDMEDGEVLDQLKTAAAGQVTERGGKWFIYPGAPAPLPYPTLTEDDLAGDFQFSARKSRRDVINGVRALFINPDKLWTHDDAVVIKPTPEMVAEDGKEIWRDKRYPFVTSARQVMRLNKIERSLAREHGAAVFPAKLTAMQLAPLDGVYLSIPRYFTGKPFRVSSWGLHATATIDLALNAHSGTEYNWSIADEEAAVNSQIIPGTQTVPEQNGITAPLTLTVPAPLLFYSQILIQWTYDGNPLVNGFDIQSAPRDGGAYVTVGQFSHETLAMNVITNVAANFRVRCLSEVGPSTFRTLLAPGDPVVNSIDEHVVNWSNGTGATSVQIWLNQALFSTIAVTGVNQTETLPTGSIHLRSVGEYGNVGNAVGPFIVSSGGGGGD